MWRSFPQLFKKIPLVLRYGVLLALALILVKTLEYQLFSYRMNLELYTGLIAAFFMLIGLATSIGWIKMRSSKQDQSSQTGPDIEPLTARERNLLAGLAEGLTNQQLADQQFLSVNTVKTHLKNLYRKLDVSSRAEAVSFAKQKSLI